MTLHWCYAYVITEQVLKLALTSANVSILADVWQSDQPLSLLKILLLSILLRRNNFENITLKKNANIQFERLSVAPLFSSFITKLLS